LNSFTKKVFPLDKILYPSWFRELSSSDKSDSEEWIEDEVLKETQWFPFKGNVAEWITACVEVALLT